MPHMQCTRARVDWPAAYWFTHTSAQEALIRDVGESSQSCSPTESHTYVLSVDKVNRRYSKLHGANTSAFGLIRHDICRQRTWL